MWERDGFAPFVIMAGELMIVPVDSARILKKISSIHLHPGYDWVNRSNDVALVEVRHLVSYTSKV